MAKSRKSGLDFSDRRTRRGRVAPAGLIVSALAVTGLVALGVNHGVSDSADHNGDGRVSYVEVLRLAPGLSPSDFTALDIDGDLALSPEELDAARSSGALQAP